jgi:L-ascorbate metabolism protein UlaG (beta-lactamase superfamily)
MTGPGITGPGITGPGTPIALIEPVLKDAALLADIKAAARDDGHFRLWWLGQSGFLMQWRGRHLLLDPYLSDSLTAKYANTDKPHVRMTARAVDPAQLDFIDVVTSSHNHTDHLDAETLVALLRVNHALTVVTPEVNRRFAAERLSVPPERLRGLRIGERLSVADDAFELEAVPAAHEALEEQFVGYIVRCGPWTIYHSGDTLTYDGHAELLQPLGVDVALLPINGRAPERRVAGNMNADEAAALAHAIGALTVIPCHYEMFTFNTADPAGLATACARLGQRCDILRCGARWESTALSPR